MSPLFGTDGIRGTAYKPPLDRPTVGRVGRALSRCLKTTLPPRILIGRDTRESGPDIESWLVRGIEAGGGVAVSAGVITTPAVAYLTRTNGFDAGIVVSASHNPYQDNGIKVFAASGEKSDEELERAIEQGASNDPRPIQGDVAPPSPDPRFEELYLDHLEAVLDEAPRLDGFRLALDCAHGAGYRVGPRLAERLGLELVALSVEPDGRNINEGCGSTHPEAVAKAVVEHRCELGAAIDGDGDRLQLVDSRGRLVDGDAILLLCARRFKKEGRLEGDGVVATVMSNMALELALAEEGIALYRTQVGDKFVAREMAERNIMIGGEQSGHIIFSDRASTGDGLLTLIEVLRVMALEGKSIDELGRLEPFPQVLRNVPVRERPDIGDVPAIAQAVQRAEGQLRGRGRLLVRYSGTEPLLRIMLEGPDLEEIERLASELGEAAERAIGARKA